MKSACFIGSLKLSNFRFPEYIVDVCSKQAINMGRKKILTFCSGRLKAFFCGDVKLSIVA